MLHIVTELDEEGLVRVMLLTQRSYLPAQHTSRTLQPLRCVLYTVLDGAREWVDDVCELGECTRVPNYGKVKVL